jgi:anti-sigma regulatory factor (Ser/Thr protein kinase)
LFASAIAVGSLFYTNRLVKELKSEERKNVELLAEATRQLAVPDLTEKDFTFLVQVTENNRTVPMILTTETGEIISYRNIDTTRLSDKAYLNEMLNEMKRSKNSIVVDLGNNERNYIYYTDSLLLKKLTYYPYYQLAIIFLFLLVSYFAFSSSRKAEQNQVWVGLSKETAHQLGTPTSSLLAWLELMKLKNPEEELTVELEKDVKRLEMITHRFSKIGSKPSLKEEDLNKLLFNTVEYLQHRISKRILLNCQYTKEATIAPVCSSLLEWVVENICKNAIDAIDGDGSIYISLKDNAKWIIIDITDTGKGIAKSKFKTIFKPGYTTKKRGWGLGLSLAKRIIEDYHSGKIFVHSSELDKGTTFRIMLNKKAK